MLSGTTLGGLCAPAGDAQIIWLFDTLQSRTLQSAVISLVEGLPASSDGWAAFFGSRFVNALIFHLDTMDHGIVDEFTRAYAGS
jgi:hypothetical protein